MDAFFALEDDLNNSFSMPKRPATQDYYSSQLPKAIPNFEKQISTIVDRLKKCLAPGGMALTTERWSLDAHGYHTWRYYSGSEFNKHRARDVRKFALGALVEEPLVMQYRKTLFRACDSATFLRLRLNEIFNGLVKARRITTVKGQLQTVQLYDFADKIRLKTKIEDLDFSVDVDELIGDSDKNAYLKMARKTITGLNKSIQNSPYAKLIPGKKEVNGDVFRCMRRLERVCHLFHLSIFTNIYHSKALIINSHRLQLMSAAIGEDLEGGNDLDPKDPAFTVDPTDILDLPSDPEASNESDDAEEEPLSKPKPGNNDDDDNDDNDNDDKDPEWKPSNKILNNDGMGLDELSALLGSEAWMMPPSSSTSQVSSLGKRPAPSSPLSAGMWW